MFSAAAGDSSHGSRVRVAQQQARRSLAMAGVFAGVAVVSAVLPHRTGAWLPLHLFLVGTLLLAISGSTQLFAVTWGSSTPAPGPMVVAQRWLLGLGAAALAAGRELDAPTAMLAAAGACVGASLVLLGALLVIEDRSARTDRFRPAVHAYLAAICAGAVGTALGAALLTGHPGVRDAHVLLNLLGMIGLVIAGTLPYFTATQARMKMSDRATPRRLHRDLFLLGASLALATTGALASRPGVVAIGLAGYAAGIGAVATTLPRPGRKQLRWAGPRLVQLAVGLMWWAGAVGLAAIRSASGLPPLPAPLLLSLVIGGYAQILLASLAYLVPVLRGGGHLALSEGFGLTASWFGAMTINSAAVALALSRDGVALLLLGATAIDWTVRWARLRPWRLDSDAPQPATEERRAAS